MTVDFAKEAKRKTLEQALEGDHAFITFNALDEAVSVPEFLKNNPLARLKLSLKFRGITSITEDGVEAELLFSGSYFNCVVPWKSLWCITTEEGQDRLWKEDIPKQAALVLAKEKIKSFLPGKKQEQPKTQPAADKEDTKKAPFLKVIK